MGGVGSGNWYRLDKKGTTDGCHSLDVRDLHRDGLLKTGSSFSTRWLRGDRQTGSISGFVHQDGVILFGNDDGAKVWVNGEKVFENRDHFAAQPGKHRIPVKLKKGANAILIKIVNGSDPHGLYFALTSEQELKAGK